MFERFSGDAQDAISRAQGSARRLHCGYVGTEHLLLGLLEQTDTLTSRLLIAHGLDWASAEAATVRLLGAAGCRADTGDPRRGADGREPDERHADALDAGALDDALDADALEAIGIDLSAVRDRVEAAFGAGALDREPARGRGRSATRGAVPFSRRARKSVELALRESLRLRHTYIGAGHLLLGVLCEGQGLAVRVLADAGVDLPALRSELEAMIPTRPEL